MPRSDQSSQGFRVTRSGTILPTLLWDYMLLSSRTEYRLDRDGIYRALYRSSNFYMDFLNASITEQWGEGKE